MDARKTVENPRYEATSPLRIGEYIQHMRDHVLIEKFHGDLALKKVLMLWVQTRWKFKGSIDVKLGSKGFFMVIFSCSADRSRIFDEGPYFFNSAGLHLRYWMERFSPRRRNSHRHLFGLDYTHYLKNFGTQKPWRE
jgi:hypothetical protein